MSVLSRFVMAASLVCSTSVFAEYRAPDREQVARGYELYERECAACHGATGEGDGPGARYLAQRPRNLTLGVFKLRSTPTGSFPTRHDLFRTLSRGIEGNQGAQMPGFASLTETDRWALVEVIRELAGMDEEGEPVTVPSRPGAADAVLGKHVYERLECGSCHGAQGHGDGDSSLTLEDDDRRRVFAASLANGHYKGGDDAEAIWLRLYTGLDGSPMPAYAGKATADELWALTDYLMSLRPGARNAKKVHQ